MLSGLTNLEPTPGNIFGPKSFDLTSMLDALSPPVDEPRLNVPSDVTVIDRIGEFEVFGVRRGGMGEVFLCVRAGDEHRVPVALKSVRPEFQFDAATRRAFQRECALWAFASMSPGVLPIYGIFHIDDRPFITMPGILPGARGETNLDDLLSRGPLPLNEAVFFARFIARSLAQVDHILPDLVHGDLTPANLLVRAGVPRISDFGLARVAGQSLHGDKLVGTAAYCSPLARDPNSSLTVADDVFSFGVILEQMVTGRLPKGSRVKKRACKGDTAYTVSADRNELLMLARNCQAKDPAQRPASFQTVADQLELIAPERQWPTPDSALWMPEARVPVQKAERIALTLNSLGECELAIQFIETVTSKKERSPLILFSQGLAFSETGQQNRALRCYRRAFVKNDLGGDFHNSVLLFAGVSHLRLGHYHWSAFIMRILIARSSSTDKVREHAGYALAAVYIEMGRYRQAEYLLREVYSDPGSPDHWNQLGVIGLRLREYNKAADAYSHAIELDPWNAQFHAGLGQALISIPQQRAKAREAFGRAIGCGTRNHETFVYALACAFLLDDIKGIIRLHRIMRNCFEFAERLVIEDQASKLAGSMARGMAPGFHQSLIDKYREHRKNKKGRRRQ